MTRWRITEGNDLHGIILIARVFRGKLGDSEWCLDLHWRRIFRLPVMTVSAALYANKKLTLPEGRSRDMTRTLDSSFLIGLARPICDYTSLERSIFGRVLIFNTNNCTDGYKAIDFHTGVSQWRLLRGKV